MTKVAFLGLGTMGSGMAMRLIDTEFEVTVYNRDPQKAAAFAGRATIASTPAQASAGADVIISMLADDNASRAVWLGAEGAVKALKPGAVCIESGTVSRHWIEEWAWAINAAGAGALDAPVTGSKPQAEKGELVFIVGGTPEVLEKAEPVLDAMSRSIVHLGPTGSGAQFKLINNFMCGVQIASLAEALTMVERAGLDRTKSIEALIGGAPGSPLVKMVSTRMATEDYRVNFLLRLMAKDLTNAVDEAQRLDLDLQTGAAALGRFNEAVDKGYGEDDIAAVIAAIR